MGECNHPDCVYSGKISQKDETKMCHYCFIFSMSRGCPANDCHHYISMTNEKRLKLIKQRYGTLKKYTGTKHRGAMS